MELKEENKILKKELRERRKAERINDWIRIGGTSILFLIIMFAFIKKTGWIG